MTTVEDRARVAVAPGVAQELTRRCSLATAEHTWDPSNVDTARAVLAPGCGGMVIDALARRVSRGTPTASGWAVLALPPMLGDQELQVAAAGLLAAVGTPFNSIDQDGRLWIGHESTAACDPGSFGGLGHNGLHIDAPNVERVPDYTSLLVMRPDPVGGGASVLGDLHAATAMLDDRDRAALSEPVYFEGRTEGLRGVGATRLPFPILDCPVDSGRPWIRWAAKLLTDNRNSACRSVLTRFADALATTTQTIMLGRGEVLVVDQQRIAHGRTALGKQQELAAGTRRWLVQAKAAYDPMAPAQTMGADHG